MTKQLLAVCCTAFMSPFVMSAPSVTVAGGTINFTGSVIVAPCTVSAVTNVNMGEVKLSSIDIAGDKSPKIPFNINLSNCDLTNTTGNVAFTFGGLTSQDSTTILQLTGHGAAGGVGLRILDSSQTPVIFDNNTAGASHTLAGTPEIAMQYTASYIATSGAMSAGTANASATFSVTYN